MLYACMAPITIRNPRAQLGDFEFLKIDCGQCTMCRKKRSAQWQFRLAEEHKEARTSYFITLTYEDDHLIYTGNGFQTLLKADFQNFMKRLRKRHEKRKDNTKIIYYACGEYGTKFKRPHYHAIIFNAYQDDISEAWDKGITDIGTVKGASIAYVCNYLNKGRTVPEQENDDRQKEFALMSKGIGKSYLKKDTVKWHKNNLDKQYVTKVGGEKLSIPRYYKEKIFDEEEKIKIVDIAKELQNIKDVETTKEITENEKYFKEEKEKNSYKAWKIKNRTTKNRGF